MNRKLWILTELFYPDQTSTGYIMTAIAKALAEDTAIEVIAGAQGYDEQKHGRVEELPGNINVTYLKVGKWDKNKLFPRILRALSLTIGMSAQLLFKVKGGDKVVVVTNPAPLLVLSALICRIKRCRFIVIVHDVFPENLDVAGIMTRKNILYKFLLSLFNRAYSSADTLIVLGRDMKALLERKLRKYPKDRIKLVPNWSETLSVIPVRREITDPVVLQFAGNFGRLQGLIPLIEAVKSTGNKHIRVDFVGGGAMLGQMTKAVEANELNNIRLLPPFSRSDQQLILNGCDMGIVSLAEGMTGLGVPSKLYNLLAAGKPLLYIGPADSEIAMLMNEHDIGWQFANCGEGLRLFLRSINLNMRDEFLKKGSNARALAEQYFSKEHVLNQYKAIILANEDITNW